ncbi:ABC transporter transmembrane domain-containing protein [Tenggerimyces flavus]|nr:ABC transporter ATP-binding protein [Tenggerimyces flavus]MBM7789587.1 ABC-type multidrug transport system fused ATPase/permease subunit [Tenggerimyces flavus]
MARTQLSVLLGEAAFSVLGLGMAAVVPYVLGRTIDDGLTAGNASALLAWASALLCAGALQAVGGIYQHRMSILAYCNAAFRTVQLLTRKATELGGALPRQVATGEVVTVGVSDIKWIGAGVEVSSTAIGLLVAFAVVTVALLGMSGLLGLVVLLGTPLLLITISAVIRPLAKRQGLHREQIGQLSRLGVDIATGIRVLRGIGGERSFAERYRLASLKARTAGVHAGRYDATLQAAQVLLPGAFVVLVVWLGGRFVVGDQITPGDLVAMYAYATFLVNPLRAAADLFTSIANALVSARRTIRILSLHPELADPETPRNPPSSGDLVDAGSGFTARAGMFTAVAADVPEAAGRVADRLGRYVDSGVTYGKVPLSDLRLADVRQRILVVDAEAAMFTGPLRDELDPFGEGDTRLKAAITAASADDIVEALPNHLDTEVDGLGRSFSGGQRQRLILARALLFDPDVLVLVDPTSAVDAHTEARIAEQLLSFRSGRTTIVMSTSPALLDRADRVAFLTEAGVVADGTHRELLTSQPQYRALVTKGEV